MEINSSYRLSESNNYRFVNRVNQIRISPIKPREDQKTGIYLKPFSSSIIQDKKRLMTKEDIKRISSKIKLIKSKCMNIKPGMVKNSSKKTLNSVWMSNEQLN